MVTGCGSPNPSPSNRRASNSYHTDAIEPQRANPRPDNTSQQRGLATQAEISDLGHAPTQVGKPVDTDDKRPSHALRADRRVPMVGRVTYRHDPSLNELRCNPTYTENIDFLLVTRHIRFRRI